MCAGAAVSGRIARIVYGAADPKAGAVLSLYNIPGDRRLNHQCEISDRGGRRPERRTAQVVFQQQKGWRQRVRSRPFVIWDRAKVGMRAKWGARGSLNPKSSTCGAEVPA